MPLSGGQGRRRRTEPRTSRSRSPSRSILYEGEGRRARARRDQTRTVGLASVTELVGRAGVSENPGPVPPSHPRCDAPDATPNTGGGNSSRPVFPGAAIAHRARRRSRSAFSSPPARWRSGSSRRRLCPRPSPQPDRRRRSPVRDIEQALLQPLHGRSTCRRSFGESEKHRAAPVDRRLADAMKPSVLHGQLQFDLELGAGSRRLESLRPHQMVFIRPSPVEPPSWTQPPLEQRPVDALPPRSPRQRSSASGCARTPPAAIRRSDRRP